MWNYSKRNTFRAWLGRSCNLEFSNTTPLPAKIYANEGVVSYLLKGNEKPSVTYANRKVNT